jgi:hypothetical protein
MDMKGIRQITQHTFANQQSNGESWYRSAISFHKEEDWDRYFDDVQEKHIIRERDGNVGITRANPETFPSAKNCERLWDLANRKWDEIQLSKQQTKIGTTADPSLRSG